MLRGCIYTLLPTFKIMKDKIELVALITVISAVVADAVLFVVSAINGNMVTMWITVICMLALSGIAFICGKIFS